MRTIVKQSEPHALQNWKRENRLAPENLYYGGGSFPGEAIRDALLSEQYHLCAYTLKALKSTADCHIEHILPQSHHREQAIDYANMLACHPAPNSKTVCDYGAVFKGNYDPGKQPFISPLHPRADQDFQFQKDGTVKGRTEDATLTINILNLNHATLVNDRKAVIKGRLAPKGQPLSAAAARRLAQMIIEPDANRRLSMFCVAVAQQALVHAEYEERRTARIKSGPKEK